MLAKIAILVDYYACHEAVYIFSDIWIKGLEGHVAVVCNRELILWLVISWVFRCADIFTAVTRTAVWQSRGPLPILELSAVLQPIASR
jgi:hypothetical protein